MKVNWSFENRNRPFLKRFPKAEGYPHFYVLTAGGEVLASQPTDVFEDGGGYDRARLLSFAQQWRTGE